MIIRAVLLIIIARSASRVLSTGGWGKVLPQNLHLLPKKVLDKSAMRIYNIYTELNQLSDKTLDDIIDKYKYVLLNESLLLPLSRQVWRVSPQKNF